MPTNPIEEIINNLDALRDTLSQESCLKKEPFIKLGAGQAPVLNYNIPQNSCFTTYGNTPLKGIPTAFFLQEAKTAPVGNFFDVVQNQAPEVLQQRFAESIQLQRADDVILPQAQVFRQNLNITASNLNAVSMAQVLNAQQGPVTAMVADRVNAINEVQLTRFALADQRPMMVERMGNYQTRLQVLPKPPQEPKPYFAIIEEYTTCSFLGDYGAGRTLKTFSLLPGEKTTITVKTYKDSTTTKAFSENLLDSYSENSTAEMEKLMEHENTASSSFGGTSSASSSSSLNFGVSASASGSLFKIVQASASTNFGTSSSSATNSSMTASRNANVKAVGRALDKHISGSNSNRQIDINTSTTSSVKEGEEASTVRELVNYNKSRVLNFVFRQLLQEYVTVTYLSNVRIAFCNGHAESLRVVDIQELDVLLEETILPAHLAEVRERILKPYCTVWNYEDDPIQFIENVVVNYGACLGTADTDTFWRIKKGIEDSYSAAGGGGLEIKVPGPILRVATHTLKTSSVIVDALLGQGEALDCYNMKLQDAAAIAEQLKNLSMLQQMELIEGVTDPVQKLELYKKVFGNCCDVPQTQIIP